MNRVLSKVAGYLVASLVVAVVLVIWQAGEGPFPLLEAFLRFLGVTLLVSLPGYLLLRGAMAMLDFEILPAFGLMGALNGVLASFGHINLVIVAIGAIAGLAAGLTERAGVFKRSCRSQAAK